MGATEDRKKKPVVEVAGSEYQPTKAEMEEEVVIDASPAGTVAGCGAGGRCEVG